MPNVTAQLSPSPIRQLPLSFLFLYKKATGTVEKGAGSEEAQYRGSTTKNHTLVSLSPPLNLLLLLSSHTDLGIGEPIGPKGQDPLIIAPPISGSRHL